MSISCIGGACFGVGTVLHMADLGIDRDRWNRAVMTVFLAGVALKVGMRYVHLCKAGSPLVEGLAVLGSPVFVGLIVFCVRRRWLAYSTAMSLLALIWLLARPYLDWVHGN